MCIDSIYKVDMSGNPANSNIVAGKTKSPTLSGILSFVVPGLGQVYNGQFLRGIVAFVVPISVYLILVFTLVGIFLLLFLVPLVQIVVAYDAYSQAKRINAGGVV